MAKPVTWAIRVLKADDRPAIVRLGGIIGSGPIWTFRTKAEADSVAEALRGRSEFQSVTVIERSHGRQWGAEVR